MKKTYKKRKMWAKPWVKHVYCARMTSTQRSESANSVLKKFIPRNASMNRFVEQYRKLLFTCGSAEDTAVHDTKQFVHRGKRVYAIERHAIQLYTKKAFQLFAEEIDKAAQYHVSSQGEGNTYSVIHSNDQVRKRWACGIFTVIVEGNGERYCCECGLYDHFGMLCCHALKVMIHTGVSKIPEAHILKRWTREASALVFADSSQSIQGDVTNQPRQSLLYGNALEVVGRANNDTDIHDIVARHLKSCMQEVDHLKEWRRKQPGFEEPSGYCSGSVAEEWDCSYVEGLVRNQYGAAGSSAYMSDSDIENMQAPKVRLPAGRPRANRYKPRKKKA